MVCDQPVNPGAVQMVNGSALSCPQINLPVLSLSTSGIITILLKQPDWPECLLGDDPGPSAARKCALSDQGSEVVRQLRNVPPWYASFSVGGRGPQEVIRRFKF